MQAVALRKLDDGEVVLIVAEPPPRVTESDLREILPGMIFARSPIGADGWVTDGIVRLKASDQKLNELVGDLHRLMYGTAYKAYVIDIPTDVGPAEARPRLDFTIAADDIHAWVLNGRGAEKPVAFMPVIGGDAVTFAEIEATDALVYHSDARPASRASNVVPPGSSVGSKRTQREALETKMNSIKQVIADYVSPRPIAPGDLTFGPEGFEARLKSATNSTRAAYWVSVALLVLLFVVVLVSSLVWFDQIIQLGANGMTAVSSVFGLSAAGCVTLMMRWAREIGRAELILAILYELRDRDPEEFNRIASRIAHQWYGLKSQT